MPCALMMLPPLSPVDVGRTSGERLAAVLRAFGFRGHGDPALSFALVEAFARARTISRLALRLTFALVDPFALHAHGRRVHGHRRFAWDGDFGRRAVGSHRRRIGE